MKIESRKNTKKYVIILIVALAIILASLATYIFAFKGKILGWPNWYATDSSINYDKPTQEQIDAGNDVKESTINPESKPSSGNNTDRPADQPPSDQTSGKKTLNMIITAANQNGTAYQIRSLIYAVVGDGTCTLSLTQGSKTVTKTADVQPSASTSTCKGFDVPVSELSAGTWQLGLRFENSTSVANVTQNITVK